MRKTGLIVVLCLLVLTGCKPKTAVEEEPTTLTCSQQFDKISYEYSFVNQAPVTQVILYMEADYSYFGYTSIEEFEENIDSFVSYFTEVFYNGPAGAVDVYSLDDKIVGKITIEGDVFDFSLILEETDVNLVTFAMLRESAESEGLSCEEY
ncbi:MAG: hypothetical protein LBR25_07850 [Erysipelotrichaceae bacterium]|jgi:hypothetical protein|nr:hypothetical protein [Erysipelotrichaceae bacterium]